MKTVIYYFSATGNSLHVAKVLQTLLVGAELRSIPEALLGEHFEVDAAVVGFVFPLHSMGLPMQMEAFMERLKFVNTPYCFAVATCGMPYIGQPFTDAESILSAKGQHLHAAWYVQLVSNYILLWDIIADWRIRFRARRAEKKLREIAAAINDRKPHTTWQLFGKLCHRIHESWKAAQQKLDEKFLCDTSACTACGLCERICPSQNITRPDGHPVWRHRCVNCLGCLHICPAKAIDYGEKTKSRKRYRHKDIMPTDLLHHFQENGTERPA